MAPYETDLLDFTWFEDICIQEFGVENKVKWLLENNGINGKHEAAWLLKAISCIDLTTLAGDDTATNIVRLCAKAVKPLSKELVDELGTTESDKTFCSTITTAAVCVYPSRVADAVKALEKLGSSLPVASVATGFPTGQYPLSTRIEEIKFCIDQGASEIDIVIDRSLVLAGKWKELFYEVNSMKKACGDVHMKAILAVGELGSLENVYKASIIAMAAGSDFIKTSTGKEAVNATLPFGMVMCRAIRDFYMKTGIRVGLKPAGGLKTSRDALNWLMLVKQELGQEWLDPKLFRIGASGLLNDIEKRLYCIATGHQPPSYYFVPV